MSIFGLKELFVIFLQLFMNFASLLFLLSLLFLACIVAGIPAVASGPAAC